MHREQGGRDPLEVAEPTPIAFEVTGTSGAAWLETPISLKFLATNWQLERRSRKGRPR